MASAGIMREFRIDELSGVDRPAQKGARATIMKRDTALPELADAAAIRKAVAELPAAPGAALAKHLIARAAALGVINALPDGFVSKHGHAGSPGSTDNEGDPMSSEIKKALGLAETASDAEVTAAIAKNAADLKTAVEDGKISKALAGMSDATRAHYAVLEKADKQKAKDFLAMEEAERKKECAKYAEGDEVITLEGRQISKRAVGDDVFAVMKGQAARLDSQAAEIAKAAQDRDMAIHKAVAQSDFPHLVGTLDERASVLKAIASIGDDGVRKAAEAILKAAEATAKVAFSKAGHGAGSVEKRSAEDQLTAKANELVKADTTGATTFAKAYERVLDTPEGAALYEQTLSGSVQE